MSNKMLKENAKKTKSERSFKGIFWVALITILVVIFLGSIKIQDKHNACLKLSDECIPLEVMEKPGELDKGLSGRENIEGGMLFVFEAPARQCMWMRDMKFDIDMVWLDESKKVVKVMENVSPNTFPNSFCADSTKYVIELNSGVVEQKSITAGQQLNF